MNSPAVAFLRRALLQHRPAIQARMTDKGRNKYIRISRPITDRDLADHLSGKCTLAAVLQHSGRGFTAAADIDHGGTRQLRDLLQKCQDRGLWAFAIAVNSGEHDGGHIFVPFSEEQDAGALRALMQEIAGSVECYPSGADLRLPFGLHRRANTRGSLLLPDGQVVNLDTDLQRGIALLESSWTPNPGQLAPLTPTPTSRPASSPGQVGKSSDLLPAILDYFDIEDRLIHYNARRAARNSYYCPFHPDDDPSLVIYTDRNNIKVCRCMSQDHGCPMAEHGRNDVINVVAIGEGVSVVEAATRLAAELRTTRPTPLERTEARPAPRTPAAPVEETRPMPPAAAELRQQALLRVSLDPKLPPCARATYQALDDAAGDRGQRAPSVDWLAQRANLDPRTVKRGLRRLETAGYILTRPRHGHTSRYTLFWRLDAEDDHGVIVRSPNMLVGCSTTCEGGHDPFSVETSQPEISEPQITEPAAPAPPPDEHSSPIASPEMARTAAPAPPADEPDKPYWNRERLTGIGALRRGPPPRPATRPSRYKQAAFTRMDGELKKQIAKKPPGQVPRPAPITSSTPAPAESPQLTPKERRPRGGSKRRGCPPSQVAPPGFNPWGIPPDDPWILQQRRALEAAEARGDVERAAFFRAVLDGL